MLATLRSLATLRGGRDDVLEPILDNLGQITAPTLIAWGQQDSIHPVDHAYVAEERMPDARLQIFDSCGHVPHMEHPEAFNKLVLEFLAEQAG